jgi:4-hydroxy-4-methyl-2-oxoglutarate aldolase
VTAPHPRVDLPRVRAELGAAVLADIMDGFGHRAQCLAAGIGPLQPDTVLAGFAFPVLVQRVFDVPADPYRGLMRALDEIGPDEVFVTPTGRVADTAVWGELLSTVSQLRGAAGALTDGLVRDTSAIRELGFPVLCAGVIPYDSKGRMEIVAHRVPCLIDGVRIAPGDLVVGDGDGIVIVPRDLIDSVLPAAFAKRAGENQFLESVRNGMSASQAFDLHGVL